jgi:hypothetical protein
MIEIRNKKFSSNTFFKLHFFRFEYGSIVTFEVD